MTQFVTLYGFRTTLPIGRLTVSEDPLHVGRTRLPGRGARRRQRPAQEAVPRGVAESCNNVMEYMNLFHFNANQARGVKFDRPEGLKGYPLWKWVVLSGKAWVKQHQ